MLEAVAWSLVVLATLYWLARLLGLLYTYHALHDMVSGTARGHGVYALIPVRYAYSVDAVYDLLGRAHVVVIDDCGDVQKLRDGVGRVVGVAVVQSCPQHEESGKVAALSRGVEEIRDPSAVVLVVDMDTRITDADTLVSTASLLAEPRRIVSFVPRFSCRTYTCTLLSVALTGLIESLLPPQLAKRSSRHAWFFGCCWAIRYDQLALLDLRRYGGRLVEDAAIARDAVVYGMEIVFVDARRHVHVDGYDSLREAVGLVSRVVCDSLRAGGSLARTLAWSISLTALELLPILLATVLGSPLAATPLLVQLTTYGYAAQVNGYGLRGLALAPLAPLTVALMILAGPVSVALRGRIVWRGRTYSCKTRD
jgi:hypothetical protein